MGSFAEQFFNTTNLNPTGWREPSVTQTSGSRVARQQVDASDGQKLIDRRQLADTTFFNQVKDILFTEPSLQIIDVSMKTLVWDGKTADADSPEGVARIAELQAAWARAIQTAPRLGYSIDQVMPLNDPPIKGNPLSNGELDSAVNF